MAEVLATGQAKGSVATSAPEGEKAAFATLSSLDLRPWPPAPEPSSPSDLELASKGSPVLKWSPVVAATAALALGGLALWQFSSMDARLEMVGSSSEPERLTRDSHGARTLGIAYSTGAGVALAACAVLGSFSYEGVSRRWAIPVLGGRRSSEPFPLALSGAAELLREAGAWRPPPPGGSVPRCAAVGRRPGRRALRKDRNPKQAVARLPGGDLVSWGA